MARSVPAVVRALDVLELFLDGRGSLSAPEVAAALDLPRTTTHELLATLSERDYVERLPDNAHRFRLGVRVSELGSVYADALDVVRDGQALVEEVSARCGELCQLGLLDGRDVVYVARAGLSAAALAAVDSTAIAINPRRTPAVRTAAGRVLLAHLPRPDLDRRLAAMAGAAGSTGPDASMAGPDTVGASAGSGPAAGDSASSGGSGSSGSGGSGSGSGSGSGGQQGTPPGTLYAGSRVLGNQQAGNPYARDGVPHPRPLLRSTGVGVADQAPVDGAAAERLRTWRELTAVVARGVATDPEGAEQTSRAIATAIRDHTGRVVAALEIRTPVGRWEPQRAVGLETLARRAALRASARLGFRPPRPVEPPASGSGAGGPRSLTGTGGHARVLGVGPGATSTIGPGGTASPAAQLPTQPGRLTPGQRPPQGPQTGGGMPSAPVRPVPGRLPSPVRAVDGGGLRPARPLPLTAAPGERRLTPQRSSGDPRAAVRQPGPGPSAPMLRRPLPGTPPRRPLDPAGGTATNRPGLDRPIPGRLRPAVPGHGLMPAPGRPADDTPGRGVLAAREAPGAPRQPTSPGQPVGARLPMSPAQPLGPGQSVGARLPMSPGQPLGPGQSMSPGQPTVRPESPPGGVTVRSGPARGPVQPPPVPRSDATHRDTRQDHARAESGAETNRALPTVDRTNRPEV